jgi:glycosyltransferase involved in cell wall biosynthesis
MNVQDPAPAPLFPPLPGGGPKAVSSRKRRICIASFDFIGPIRNGGVGTAFTSLGEALAADGHEVTFLYLSGSHCETAQPLEHWISDYRRKGIRFVPLPEQLGARLEAPWHMGKSYEAYRWLCGQSFDIVHFSEWRAPGYYTLVAKHQGLAFAQTELCVHTHGPTLWSLLSNGEYLSQLSELELDFMERESVRLADWVVSPSHYLLRWMQEQGWTLPERTCVQQYIRPSSARCTLKTSFAGPRPVDEWVFFGRLEIRKGLVLFCDALDRLANDSALSRLKVTFLGKLSKINDRDGADYLADRATSWPWPWKIISDRDQGGALDYLQGAGRVALIPSIVDNLPNTVLECLGAGVPFLASTTGGIPEMVAPDDRAGTLFPLRTAELAESLRRAVLDGVRPARFAVEPGANRTAWLDWHRRDPVCRAPEGIPSADLPLVSICLSHFNRPEYLRQALASIEAQDYPRIEVVLVDDASTQPQAIAYVDSLAPKFAERGWRLVRNPEELFVGAARNVAARHASGEYLKFMDDDNIAKPNEVSTFVRVAQRTRADVVSCALDFFSGDAPPPPGQMPKFRFLFLGAAAAASALRNYYGDTNSLFRREVFIKLGGFHEERRVGMEDWKLIGSAVLQGFHLEVVPEALVWYRRTEYGDNASARNSLHAGHMQCIGPYLNAVPPELRNLVLYAQGMSMKGGGAGDLFLYAQLTIKWKSKLEAGVALAGLDQPAAAAKAMLDGIKAVQTCGVPRIVLEALLEIGEHLAPLDPGRARYLLGLAAKLAESHSRTKDIARARRLIRELDARRTAPAPVLA